MARPAGGEQGVSPLRPGCALHSLFHEYAALFVSSQEAKPALADILQAPPTCFADEQGSELIGAGVLAADAPESRESGDLRVARLRR
jgi:hypothetical protein